MTAVPTIDDYDAAVAFLDARIGRGVQPGLDRMIGTLDLLADPHRTVSAIHVAGTNGKTTVTWMLDSILGAHGLRTATFTSPHLTRIEERYSVDGDVISPERFTEAVADIAWFVEEYERRNGLGPTYFELTTLLAFSIFAEVAVDAAIIETGLGGRWDATNVVDAAVSVVTGIARDHVEYLGESLAEIAAEKAAIVKPGGTLVTGPLPPAAEGPFTARVAETGSRWFRSNDDFGVDNAVRAVGGWNLDVTGLYASYDDVYLPLHGRHQSDNLGTAIAAAEAFVGRALDGEVLRLAASQITSPGRIEVVGRHPVVIIDGAHNEQGIEALAEALAAEFPPLDWHLVVGMRGDRDPAALLAPLRGLVAHAWATEPDDAAAVPVDRLASALADTLAVEVSKVAGVVPALEAAKRAAGEAGGVIVTGSLYVVGEARTATVGHRIRPSGVHVRYEASPLEGEGADEG